MKIAISIPNEIFTAAEQMARKLGLSRSEFYARAVRSYLDECLSSDVTKRLNEIYARESPGVDPVLSAIQTASLPCEDWS